MRQSLSQKKTCLSCQKTKPVTEFFKRADKQTSYRSKCKECFVKSTNVWKNKNKHKIKEYNRRMYLKHNRKEYYQKWRDKNRERVRELGRIRKRKHPEITSLHENRRRIRKLGNGGSHSIKEWEQVKKTQNYLCLFCKEGKPLTRDHITPISKGGSDNISNIQALCKNCNCKKYNK